MAAIDLLLNWSPASERMHQVVLAGLLQHTPLLRQLGISGSPLPSVATETQGRLFDFTVPLDKGRNVQIELKVDATLSDDQMRRQMAAAAGANDVLMYVLLGTTQFCSSRGYIEDFRVRQQVSPKEEDVIVVDLATMRRAVSSLIAETRDPDHRDLAAAYDSLLRYIEESFWAFEAKPLGEWISTDWFGFYDHLRRALCIDCSMAYVNNPSGGFVGCWWDATQPDSDDDCEVYLQLEHDKLCFKISICEQHINSAAHFRDRFSDTVLTAGTASGLHIKRPDRFGRGTWMTVAVLDRDYRAPVGASKVDWSYVQGIIGAADKVLKNAARQFAVV